MENSTSQDNIHSNSMLQTGSSQDIPETPASLAPSTGCYSRFPIDGYPVTRISLSPSGPSLLGQGAYRCESDLVDWSRSTGLPATVSSSFRTNNASSTFPLSSAGDPRFATGFATGFATDARRPQLSAQTDQDVNKRMIETFMEDKLAHFKKDITSEIHKSLADFMQQRKRKKAPVDTTLKRAKFHDSSTALSKQGATSTSTASATFGRSDHGVSSSSDSEAQLLEEVSSAYSSEQSEDEEGQLPKERDSSSEDNLDMCQVINVKGPKISEKVAKDIDKNLTDILDKKEIRKLMTNLNPPENCSELKVPSTNRLLFNKMPSYSQKKDKELQKIQFDIVCNLTAASQLKSLLVEARESKKKIDLKKCNKLASKIIKTSIVNMQNINKTRRFNVRKNVPQDLIPLCTVPERGESQDFLFGDTSSKLEEVNKQNKLLNKLRATATNKKSNHTSDFKTSSYGFKHQYSNTKNYKWGPEHPHSGSSRKWGHQKYKNQQKGRGRGNFQHKY